MTYKAGRLASRLRAIAAGALIGGALLTYQPALAEETGVVSLSAARSQTVEVGVGKPRTLRADASFAEIVVGDPDVAVVTPLTDRTFYVVGTKPGVTGVALYNEAKELVGMLDIEVGPDAGQINTALGDTGVRAETANGRVVLTGKAKSPTAAAKAREIAKRFDEEPIDTTTVAPSTQVTLEVRFIEASRRSNKELGISVHGNKQNGNLSGNSNGLLAPSTLYSNNLALTNSLISGSLPFGQIIGGLLTSGMSVDVLVQALESRGVLPNRT